MLYLVRLLAVPATLLKLRLHCSCFSVNLLNFLEYLFYTKPQDDCFWHLLSYWTTLRLDYLVDSRLWGFQSKELDGENNHMFVFIYWNCFLCPPCCKYGLINPIDKCMLWRRSDPLDLILNLMHLSVWMPYFLTLNIFHTFF